MKTKDTVTGLTVVLLVLQFALQGFSVFSLRVATTWKSAHRPSTVWSKRRSYT
jgi:hypothetical protein